ncbi:MAG TPA: hypothetical protein VJ692_10930 [Nitrospiraceae bacterium]|nr:hypothetical protein [Nitrospiraceae bacterium]
MHLTPSLLLTTTVITVLIVNGCQTWGGGEPGQGPGSDQSTDTQPRISNGPIPDLKNLSSAIRPLPPAGIAAYPKEVMDTTYAPPSGNDMAVKQGDNLQAKIDAAPCGSKIKLDAGATFTGAFVLKNKGCSAEKPIYIMSADLDRLPSEGKRVSPKDATHMPKIQAAGGLAFSAEFGTGYYWLVGLEILSTVNDRNSIPDTLIDFGEQPDPNVTAYPSKQEDFPHHIVIDRCYIHGQPRGNLKRGVALNGTYQAIINSYLSEIHGDGVESKGINGWAGPGPFMIYNNHIEAAGINVFFGGASTWIENINPSDIVIARNHITKNTAWRQGSPNFAGVAWTAKNLIELKNAKRVLLDSNVLENSWVHAQAGQAVLYSPQNDQGNMVWSTVEDVTFQRNLVRHTAMTFHVLGWGWPNQTKQSKRKLNRHNVFDDIDWVKWGGFNRARNIMMDSGSDSDSWEHNTFNNTGSERGILTADHCPHSNLVFRDNIIFEGRGVLASGYSPGGTSLEACFPGKIWAHNILIDGSKGNYPSGNFFPSKVDQVGFTDYKAANFKLLPSSPYKGKASDGTDPGADYDEVTAATEGVID